MDNNACIPSYINTVIPNPKWHKTHALYNMMIAITYILRLRRVTHQIAIVQFSTFDVRTLIAKVLLR
jgi:hypothetical protein